MHVTSELRVSFRAIYVFVAGVKAYIYSGVPWYYESRSSCGTITVYVSSSLTYRGDAVTHCFQASIKTACNVPAGAVKENTVLCVSASQPRVVAPKGLV